MSDLTGLKELVDLGMNAILLVMVAILWRKVEQLQDRINAYLDLETQRNNELQKESTRAALKTELRDERDAAAKRTP